MEIIMSDNPDISTFTCPSCKVIWRAKGEFEDFTGGWHFNNEDLCPIGCRNFLGLKIKGNEVGDNRVDICQLLKSFITSR